jgi:uncharacterized protein YbcI
MVRWPSRRETAYGRPTRLLEGRLAGPLLPSYREGGELTEGSEHGTSARGLSAGPAASGQLLLAISNRIVSLQKKLYGKGPTKARTFYHDDVVLVVTRGGFSRVEETLQQAGRGAAVLAQRAEFQQVVEGEFVAAIEELTGRHVQAFMSANHQDPDMAAELFILDPAASGAEVGAGEGRD